MSKNKRVFSEEHKKKISESLKAKKIVPPMRKGVKLTTEHKEKIKKWAKDNKDKIIGENNPSWKGGISQDYYRRVAFENLPNVCEACGSQEKLRVHHKNKNRQDNRIENLMIVCKSCHNKIHEKWKNLYKRLK